MTQWEFKEIEDFMLQHMQDSAHDKHHVYRVLNAAIDIAQSETWVDMDVLIAAALLHDVGRERQFDDLENLCHAQIGGDMAYEFLLEQNWDDDKALHVKDCINSHRYRGDNPPTSIEAKILFDADKLDVCGLIGIARTLVYSGRINEPIYIMTDDGSIVTEGGGAEISSFFQEYNYKLKKVHASLYTARAAEIAEKRQKSAANFYETLHVEIIESYENAKILNF